MTGKTSKTSSSTSSAERQRPTASPKRKAAARPPAGRRTVKRDPEGTRRKILDAATEEFARHGFGGARVERISTRARTVDRMLYYYFGSKEGLFRTVLEKCYDDLGQAEQALNLRNTPPLEGMRALIAFTWEYYLAHPAFVRILNSENLHRGEHLRRMQHVSTLAFPLLSILEDILRRGADEGSFRSGVDAIQLYITIAALGYFYLSNRYTLSKFLATDLMEASALETRLAHMTEMVLTYLRPLPVGTSAPPTSARSDEGSSPGRPLSKG